ncbi:hypothetical protein ABZS66_45640 [Dactylosporangium sp. NPDC005572]|uniref:hypothetical protein n=1 Tax=Dactylosporangium sp. NPDC005572 TaxID=3156889 RepID=UPI0033A4EA6B
MATIRFATPGPRGSATVLLDLQEHPARLDRTALLNPPHDLARQQHVIVTLLQELAIGPGRPGPAGAVPSTPADFGEQLTTLLSSDRRDVVARLVGALAKPDVAGAIADLDTAGQLTSVIRQTRRLRGLEQLRARLADEDHDDDRLHEILRSQPWLFGGRYGALRDVGEEVAERIPLLLIRSDGAFHVVVAGPVDVPDLVVADDQGHYGAGPAVQRAVGRAISQLEILDGLAARLREEPKLQDLWFLTTRRAMASVVVGHRRSVPSDIREELIRPALRTYCSHLNGIDVITWDELVEIGERVTMADPTESAVDHE